MKKIIFVIVIFCINLVCAQSAKTDLINPENNWYFGVEIGSNNITSFHFKQSDQSFQGGVLAEYHFAKHWSLSARIKYFKTGVSFYKPDTHSGSWFDLGTDAYFGSFYGSEINIPVNIKWDFRIYKNFSGNLKFGLGYGFETESNYENYSPNLNTNDYSKTHGSLITGYGFNYFINHKMAVYIDYEFIYGVSKGYSKGLFGSKDYSTKNTLFNIGIKYNFKK